MKDAKMDESFRTELHEMLARTKNDPAKVALRSSWLDEQVPPVANRADYDRYGRLEGEIIAGLRQRASTQRR